MVGLVGALCDAFELLQLTEEVLDEVAPLVGLQVDLEGRRAGWVLRDDDLGAALVQFGHKRVAVEGLVRDQPAKGDILDQGRDTDAVVAVAWEQDKAY